MHLSAHDDVKLIAANAEDTILKAGMGHNCLLSMMHLVSVRFRSVARCNGPENDVSSTDYMFM